MLMIEGAYPSGEAGQGQPTPVLIDKRRTQLCRLVQIEQTAKKVTGKLRPGLK